MNFIAAKKRDVAVRINEALIKCSKISPLVGQYKIFKNNAIGMIIMDWTRNREKDICPIGISFEASLANVSITGPIIVKPKTSNIPNSG